MTISEEKGLEIVQYRSKVCREVNALCDDCPLHKKSNLYTIENNEIKKVSICSALSKIAVNLIQ